MSQVIIEKLDAIEAANAAKIAEVRTLSLDGFLDQNRVGLLAAIRGG